MRLVHILAALMIGWVKSSHSEDKLFVCTFSVFCREVSRHAISFIWVIGNWTSRNSIEADIANRRCLVKRRRHCFVPAESSHQ